MKLSKSKALVRREPKALERTAAVVEGEVVVEDAFAALVERVDRIERRLTILWQEHPALYLKGEYGQDLLEWDRYLRLSLPANPKDVYEWPWNKVQQYHVFLHCKDPGKVDSQVVRAHVCGTLTGWLHQRQVTERAEAARQAQTAPAPKKVLLKAGSHKLLIRKPATEPEPEPPKTKLLKKVLVRRKA